MNAKAHRSSTSYHAGVAAEHLAAQHYVKLGFVIEKQRWRGKGGEIDLVLRGPDGLVFVEVKKSRSFEAAVRRINQKQMQRMFQSAEEFLGGEPDGLLTNARIDVALVDGMGAVQIIENAFGHG